MASFLYSILYSLHGDPIIISYYLKVLLFLLHEMASFLYSILYSLHGDPIIVSYYLKIVCLILNSGITVYNNIFPRNSAK